MVSNVSEEKKGLEDADPSQFSTHDFLSSSDRKVQEEATLHRFTEPFREGKENLTECSPLSRKLVFVSCFRDPSGVPRNPLAERRSHKEITGDSHREEEKHARERKETSRSESLNSWCGGRERDHTGVLYAMIEKRLLLLGWSKRQSSTGMFDLILGGDRGRGIPFARMSQLFRYDYGVRPLCNYYVNHPLLENKAFLVSLLGEKDYLLPVFSFIHNDEEFNATSLKRLRDFADTASQKYRWTVDYDKSRMRNAITASKCFDTDVEEPIKWVTRQGLSCSVVPLPCELLKSKGELVTLSFAGFLSPDYLLYVLREPRISTKTNGTVPVYDLFDEAQVEDFRKQVCSIGREIFTACKPELCAATGTEEDFHSFQLFGLEMYVRADMTLLFKHLDPSPSIGESALHTVVELALDKGILSVFKDVVPVSGAKQGWRSKVVQVL